ncbi:vacuolar sorting protein 9 domain-containing protein [Entamoeba histolytica HM-3:IMSS]|uniref:Vacuolar sorting protein 9 domain-containing protein n=1 Tax=Entamoeba histolytica HM-3:IMSS TaxID=885315 RepID=M7XAV2_ENTHI|nr:vacuolar sorting protein 9 domain-containing protein [Entamoeba histolytica HM-3:IMSS]
MGLELLIHKFKKYLEQHQDDIKSIKQFKKWFSTEQCIESEEVEKVVKSLYQTILYNLSLNEPPFTFEEQKLCVEYIIMEELYENIFATNEEIETDVRLIKQIILMQKIPISKYQVSQKIINEQNWNRSKDLLIEINNFKTPTEKLNSINKCFRNIIYHNNITLQMSCDEILEILTYLIVQCQPPMLYSNISFIRKCCFDLTSENDYFLTQLEVCVQLILQYTPSSLSKKYDKIVENKIVNSPPISSASSQITF